MASIYDDIISGTFNTLGPSATSGWTTPSPSYQSGMMGRGQPYGSDRLAPTWQPSLAAIEAMAPTYAGGPSPSASAYAPTGGSVSLPRPRPGNAPTSIDMAAINGQPGVNKVTGQMTPGMGQGGLLSLLMGQSKNGLPGLAGLLGGPQQGGLLQMLMGQFGKRAPIAPAAQNGLTPAQQYAFTNNRARDMARMQAGLPQLYSDPNGGAHSDYGGTGAGSDHPYFSSGFGTAQGI